MNEFCFCEWNSVDKFFLLFDHIPYFLIFWHILGISREIVWSFVLGRLKKSQFINRISLDSEDFSLEKNKIK